VRFHAKKNTDPGELSGTEPRRGAIARSLANIGFDEATAASGDGEEVLVTAPAGSPTVHVRPWRC
jgi:ABC-type polar amino acid transport system ATPase subunit